MKVMIIRLLAVTAVLGFAIVINLEDVKGKTHEGKQLEEFIEGNNYVLAKDAIHTFEKELGKKISLPKKLPFEPTHQFGRINRNEDYLKLHYIRPGKTGKYPTRDFIFFIMSEKELEHHTKSQDKVFELENGDNAYYRKDPGNFHTLAFKRNGFGYLLVGNTTDHFDLERLTEIAELFH